MTALKTEDLPRWIFGYGSLMWNPGFAPEETAIAQLAGYRRSFCMWSVHHRGTEEDPGLVLALDTDGAAVCDGIALRVAEAEFAGVLEMLRERELVSSAYYEDVVTLRLADGRETEAVTYIVDRTHVQYCAGLPLAKQAEVIARAVGGRGPNTEYLDATVANLRATGLEDAELEWLAAEVARITG